LLFIITFTGFFIWAVIVSRKGRFNWHTLVSIYFIILFVADYGDVSCEYWFGFYELPVHMLRNLDKGNYLGIIFSDGLIFPLIAIVFCFYVSRYRRPLLLSFIFAVMLGMIEYVFVTLGYMIYHLWYHWTTAVISFLALSLLARFAVRFISYSPPVPYRLRLLCAVYVITEWPGAIFGGMMRLYYFRPYIFENETGDDRLVAMILATAAGAMAAAVIPKIPQKFRLFFFLSLGAASAVFGLLAYSSGILTYGHWNSVLTVIRYVAPYYFVYLYDRWESGYTALNIRQNHD
jgi:hypothetical protein